MADYFWSTLSSGTTLAFDPAADVFIFDNTAIAAAIVAFDPSRPNVVFNVGFSIVPPGASAKIVTLQTAPATLGPTNIVFADGSTLKIGDGTTGITNDGAANMLTGGAGADFLAGLDGDDTLQGGAGADTMIGGPGDDSYEVDDAGDVVIENPDEGTDTVRTTVDYAAGSSIENIVLVGSGDLSANGNAAANHLTGNAGGNMLDGAEGDDTLLGMAGDDTLLGGDGGDILDGGAGDDRMDGAEGDDTYIVDSLNDTIDDASGADLVQSYVPWVLGAGLEDLTLLGSASYGIGNGADNHLVGTDGDNLLLRGMGGADTIEGGGGNDWIEGDSVPPLPAGESPGADTLAGGSGDDTVLAGGGDDTVRGDDGADILSGEADADVIDGGRGDDVILGDRGEPSLVGGDDVLRGDLGRDQIDGGAGADLIYGGDDADIIDGDEGSDFILAGGGPDLMLGSAASAYGPETVGADLFVYTWMGEAGDEIWGFDTRPVPGEHDGIDLRPLFDALGYSGTAPRAEGWMTVTTGAVPTDSVVWIDPNGGGNSFTPLLTLHEVAPATLTDSFFLFQ